MFKFAKKREVLWPVKIGVPRGDGSGEIDQVEVRVHYKLLDMSEMAEAMRDTAVLDLGGLLAAEAMQASDARLRTKILGWDGIVDAETGVPVPFSEDTLAALLQVPYVRKAFANGLWGASQGAAAKNSLPGPAGSLERPAAGPGTAKAAAP